MRAKTALARSLLYPEGRQHNDRIQKHVRHGINSTMKGGGKLQRCKRASFDLEVWVRLAQAEHQIPGSRQHHAQDEYLPIRITEKASTVRIEILLLAVYGGEASYIENASMSTLSTAIGTTISAEAGHEAHDHIFIVQLRMFSTRRL